jgi:hypothetical protein
MIKTQNDIDEYFTTDKFDTDDRVELANDKVLLKQFLSAVITRITNKSPKTIYFAPTYSNAWRSTNHETDIGVYAFQHDYDKKDNFTLEMRYHGGELDVKRDSSGCLYITGNKKRKSLKVTEKTILIRPKWITPLVVAKFEEAQKVETDGKIMKFQNELLAPYMMQKLLDVGVPESLISVNNSYIKIINLGNRNWYSTVGIYPVNDEPTENIEDRKWQISLHKTSFTNLSFESVIKIVSAFQESGLFKL